MTVLLVDTSVLIKWFHSDGETELPAARAMRSAHVAGEVDAHIIDLAIYEIGNVLIRALHWRAADVADQLDDLFAIVGPALALSSSAQRRAAILAEQHSLTYYDACWAAAALELDVPLVSADSQLLAASLAESPTTFTARFDLPR